MSIQSWLWFLAWRALRIAMLAYLGLVILMAGCQRGFVYHPARLRMDDAETQARSAGLTAWPGADASFIGWRRPRDVDDGGARPRVLVFHGNAGHALHRAYYLDGFDGMPGDAWDVILFEYPGFGPRSGKPSESTIHAAAESAFDILMREDPSPIYVVGESLGSGPACRLAGDHPDKVAGVWLVTPFTSLVDVARIHYPVFPVRLLLRDRFDNRKALQSYDGPLMVLTAGHDAVVPARLGQRLYEAAATSRKCRVEQPEADHNSLDLSPRAGVWSDLADCWLDHRP